ncbi:MAG: hypothetical protein CVT98_06780 [Bacteroidetes bacterium HGW-Bacteroidetes-15]|nr:MAG: hypothetical protein CVT98_06780 [Bacteroidetes bacterium HGW-Bacteroidetes-15]
MKKTLIPLIVFTLLSSFGYTQQWKLAPLELYGGIPTFHYFGDIGGSATESNLLGLKDITLRKLRPGINLGARYQIIKPLLIRGSYSFGFLAQSDINSRNEARNFAFSTIINEAYVSAELYIIPESDENYYYSIMQVRGGLRHFRQPLSLYVTLGAGGVHYRVTAKDALVGSSRFVGDKSFTMVVPFGIGIKYAIMPKVSLGAELIARYTMTDYLDGVTSDFSEFNDIYYSLNINVNYKIQKTRKKNIGLPRKRFFFF